MKKLLLTMILFLCLFAFTACGGEDDPVDDDNYRTEEENKKDKDDNKKSKEDNDSKADDNANPLLGNEWHYSAARPLDSYFTFYEDGTWSMYGEGGAEEYGTYEISDGKDLKLVNGDDYVREWTIVSSEKLLNSEGEELVRLERSGSDYDDDSDDDYSDDTDYDDDDDYDPNDESFGYTFLRDEDMTTLDVVLTSYYGVYLESYDNTGRYYPYTDNEISWENMDEFDFAYLDFGTGSEEGMISFLANDMDGYVSWNLDEYGGLDFGYMPTGGKFVGVFYWDPDEQKQYLCLPIDDYKLWLVQGDKIDWESELGYDPYSLIRQE